MPLPDLADHSTLARLLRGMSMTVAGDAEPIGDEYGFASSRVAVAARLANGRTLPVVVKVWDARRIGLSEIEFYDEWAPLLPIRLPRCHGADATADHGILVLEDLRPLRQCDEEEPLSPGDGRAVAEALALIHRATVGRDTDLPPGRWQRVLPSEWHDTRRVAFSGRFGLPHAGDLRRIIVHSEEADRLGHALLADSAAGLTHGDVHSDNLVFKDSEPVLLDWSHPGWGPGAHDLASLLYSSSAVDDYDLVIDAYSSLVPVTERQVAGALLKRLVIATLGIALWKPDTPREERLIHAGLRRAERWAAWLFQRNPTIAAQLS